MSSNEPQASYCDCGRNGPPQDINSSAPCWSWSAAARDEPEAVTDAKAKERQHDKRQEES